MHRIQNKERSDEARRVLAAQALLGVISTGAPSKLSTQDKLSLLRLVVTPRVWQPENENSPSSTEYTALRTRSAAAQA